MLVAKRSAVASAAAVRSVAHLKVSAGVALRQQRQVICSASSNENFQRAATQAASAAKDAANAAKDAAAAAAIAAGDAVKNLRVPDMAKLDIDMKKTLTWNFAAQLTLTGMSWAIAFTTSHAAMAKGVSIHPTTALLMVGVLLSGYSTYLSYNYLLKVKGQGLDILQGWTQLKAFNEHLMVNFVGAAATVLALQAEVGIMMVSGMTKSAGGLGLAALAQASTNTLLAHLVSVVFLTFMIRKITAAYQRVLEWGENIANSMPRL
ncbi:hypothetical protein COO60DRAFT_1479916 [Scenedesmus sp. NREL 46B-D3]|nr:hypothetical protein COO60DRAFT_1479916 [Scenedesmus sp. NREL 46B-D3]